MDNAASTPRSATPTGPKSSRVTSPRTPTSQRATSSKSPSVPTPSSPTQRPTTQAPLDPNVTRHSSSPNTTSMDLPWLPNMNLSIKEKVDIKNKNGWLNDKVIDAVNVLVGEHLGQTLNQSTVLAHGPVGYTATTGESIQILYDSNHWVASAYIGGEIRLADSLGRVTVSEGVARQLRQLYAPGMAEGKVEVSIVPSPRQDNGSDCGIYAAAVAYEWAQGQQLPRAWEVQKMRGHLVSSLEAGKILSFPSLKRGKGRRPRVIKIFV